MEYTKGSGTRSANFSLFLFLRFRPLQNALSILREFETYRLHIQFTEIQMTVFNVLSLHEKQCFKSLISNTYNYRSKRIVGPETASYYLINNVFEKLFLY